MDAQVQHTVEPPRVSPYSLKEKVARVLWGVVSWLFWQRTPRSWNGLRVAMLRLFGAGVGTGVLVDPSVRIEIPWNLTLGDHVRVCERAILYCLGPVRIGAGSLVGPYAHVCAGTHDYTNPRFRLIRAGIDVGSRCALLTASFVGPGVTVSDGTVLKPRAALFTDSAADTTYSGCPARPDAVEGAV